MKATANYFVINILILLVEWINTDMRTPKTLIILFRQHQLQFLIL